MIYFINNDDFLPECSKRRYPLLRAIHSEFKAAYIEKQGDKNATLRSRAPIHLICRGISNMIFFFLNDNLKVMDNFNILHRNNNKQRASEK
jgi:hypothetical protein